LNEKFDKADSSMAVPDIRWLVAGAIAGLLAAGYGMLRQDPSTGALPDNAIARVNETIISRDNYQRNLARVPSGKSGSPTTEEQARLIDGLVNEELLLQRGIELGMAESDSAVRTAILDSLVASITAEADAANPSEQVLEQHLRDNPERFSYVARMSVDGWQTDDESIAQSFANGLREAPEVPSIGGIEAIPGLPAGLIPVEILSDHVGPGIAAAAANMPVESSAVFARRGRWIIIRITNTESAVITDLNSIRNQVLLHHRRELADGLLNSYLDDLRSRADIEVALP
jgi:hypothetical protein